MSRDVAGQAAVHCQSMGWYEALKDAINVAQKADNVGLTRQLLDAQRELLDMQAENNALRAKISDLQAHQQTAQHMHYEQNVYWRRPPGQGIADGPFCPRCFDADQKVVRLMTGKGRRPTCQNCKSIFVSDYEGPVIA